MAMVFLIWLALFAVFFCLVRRSCFARFGQVFFFLLMAASVAGIGGYQAAKAVVSHPMVVELENVADRVNTTSCLPAMNRGKTKTFAFYEVVSSQFQTSTNLPS
jgi:hypothetical protein